MCDVSSGPVPKSARPTGKGREPRDHLAGAAQRASRRAEPVPITCGGRQVAPKSCHRRGRASWMTRPPPKLCLVLPVHAATTTGPLETTVVQRTTMALCSPSASPDTITGKGIT